MRRDWRQGIGNSFYWLFNCYFWVFSPFKVDIKLMIKHKTLKKKSKKKKKKQCKIKMGFCSGFLFSLKKKKNCVVDFGFLFCFVFIWKRFSTLIVKVLKHQQVLLHVHKVPQVPHCCSPSCITVQQTMHQQSISVHQIKQDPLMM